MKSSLESIRLRGETSTVGIADRRLAMRLWISLAMAAALAVVVWRQAQRPVAGAGAAAVESGPRRVPSPMSGVDSRREDDPRVEAVTPAPVAPPVERYDLSRLREPSEVARRLVQGMWNRGGASGPMTKEEMEVWKENWDRLVETGVESVPALAEYLRGSQDTFFAIEDHATLGFRSAREAAIQALFKLGGAEAVAVMEEAIGMTGSPREVALLARGLDVAASGQYREQTLAAVRESLEMAAQQQLGGLDVAPLFEVLQSYGGMEVAGELERAAARWGQYATLALAGLPDGAGLPSLLRMADPAPETKPHAAKLEALQVVAGMAMSNDEARAALLNQARTNRISPYHWPHLARPLAGEQARLQNSVFNEERAAAGGLQTGSVHIAGTNQNLLWVRPEEGMSPEQFARRAALIAELRAATTSPDGRKVLDQALALLEQQRNPAAKADTPH